MTANQRGLNIFSGWQYEFAPYAAMVKLLIRATTAGVLCKVQVADAVSVETTPAHVLVPRAVTLLVTVQALAGETKVAVKLAEAPGARLASVKTVLGEAWVSITVTLLSVTLPGLLTVPEKVMELPVTTGITGQFKLTAISGVPVIEHVAEAALVTRAPEQLSLPLAVRVEVLEQAVPAGTV